MIVAIGGGGFIPARMLRTEVKVPIVAVGLEFYDDNTNTINKKGVQIKQWFSTDYGPGALVENGRVLIVDEVDDTRTTLAACVSELRKRHKPSQVGCLVVHNKLKAKRASLPQDVTYIACEEVPDEWNCYPWDAAAYGLTARAHARRADASRRRRRQGLCRRRVVRVSRGARRDAAPMTSRDAVDATSVRRRATTTSAAATGRPNF